MMRGDLYRGGVNRVVSLDTAGSFASLKMTSLCFAQDDAFRHSDPVDPRHSEGARRLKNPVGSLDTTGSFGRVAPSG